ncbi:hypothetical protein BDY21DRAFT_93450 [Lineolata rhizophorae]|uniref:(4-O-methyl)-D-glucuronate--lignin esterase n=1 Tax=Lineolata rhizophorae TaxID=578093 RepID=A0A6A6PD36_9PEZI|nr:hypothetical protein BDY21DRAFT_93450 [Lineolata rhizophorae]
MKSIAIALGFLSLAAAQDVCPTLPADINFSEPALPDPFVALDGSEITTVDAWECRREEIRDLFQRYELGPKPPKPSEVSASFSGDQLTINCSEDGSSISWSVQISYPSSGQAPYPAIIGYGGGSIPTPAGVASINFFNDEIADQITYNRGKFYDLYGSESSSAALIAWAWAVSRIVDALEMTPDANVDTNKLAVTGCSRNGKGAMIAGAFDDRIVLTIPQESGSGGPGCWRLVQQQKDQGGSVETAGQIVQGDAWFSRDFSSYTDRLDELPYDHHMLTGLFAPRGLLIIENTAFEWLGDMSTYGCSVAGQKIFESLGAGDNMGYSQVSHSDHCGFPSSQQPELTAFFDKFLLDRETDTDVFKTDGNFNFDESQWIQWDVPELA